MAKTKKFLWDPLGCSDLSQIFFGSSPTAIYWDKIGADIINTTFVFLGHPKDASRSRREQVIAN